MCWGKPIQDRGQRVSWEFNYLSVLTQHFLFFPNIQILKRRKRNNGGESFAQVLSMAQQALSPTTPH